MAASKSEINGATFRGMGLDDRVLKALAKLGWSSPTLIQEKAIPLALEGKDILARARTGSGKTAAYAIPLVQKILTLKETAREQATRALILVPSRELCSQAFKNIQEISKCCSKEIKCADVSGQVDLSAQRPLLMERPDIVLGTPSRILAHIQAKNLSLQNSLEMLVIDEADLVFSFGHEADMRALLSHFPKIYQAILMSATLSEDVKTLKKLVLHNPITLKLAESQLPEADRLSQYQVRCIEEDKYLLIYTLLKLKLIRGKTIIFVNSIDRCYRLKLYLEQFSVPVCLLNSELPVNSRCHIVNQFNTGLYDIIVASEESSLFDGGKRDEAEERKEKKGKGQKVKQKKDKEYGVSRGIDFQNVSNVINFDFPESVKSYIHRVGRTARGEKMGTALSFVNEQEQDLLDNVEQELIGDDGTPLIKPYQFKMSEIEGFRYRAKDAMRAVTKVAVREARVKEIKQEIFNSKKLKAYFEDNPRDLQLLRHDKILHPAKVHSDLKNVPEYLVPKALRGTIPTTSRRKAPKRAAADGKGVQKRESRVAKMKRKTEEDPLQSFKYKGKN
ncbi:probable ATP-dependent RNA helicase DDX56 [Strongylocentrotus purpuratus]|uniref:Probable ATP-dependent RNA helicase DDX56 n=1 Tax=Strongylocentrotus purpuratus TaxID=7668 RepID=A0A7M7NUL7_STRPU|nr:probable ATP-dependent RNA helicase DDX56 [Strongylocentrotus purpuratus]